MPRPCHPPRRASAGAALHSIEERFSALSAPPAACAAPCAAITTPETALLAELTDCHTATEPAHLAPQPRCVAAPTSGVWSRITRQARDAAAREPLLRRLLDDSVLSQPTPARALSAILARRIGAQQPDVALHALLLEVLSEDRALLPLFEADLQAVTLRDPACRSSLHALLHFKGFHALQAQRVAHSLWRGGRHDAALWLGGQVAQALAVDIHPAVPIGPGVLLDHATGVVVGETALIEAGVTILHGVTLGATGKQRGDRHPKVRRGATLGAGAAVLGNLEIGCESLVGAGSVVLHDVPPHSTVA